MMCRDLSNADDSLSDAANYCRNPDGEPYTPWCYTTDRNKRWELCDVHHCSRKC